MHFSSAREQVMLTLKLKRSTTCFVIIVEMFVLKHLDDYSEGITKEEYEQGIKDGRIVVIKCKHLDALL